MGLSREGKACRSCPENLPGLPTEPYERGALGTQPMILKGAGNPRETCILFTSVGFATRLQEDRVRGEHVSPVWWTIVLWNYTSEGVNCVLARGLN